MMPLYFLSQCNDKTERSIGKSHVWFLFTNVLLATVMVLLAGCASETIPIVPVSHVALAPVSPAGCARLHFKWGKTLIKPSVWVFDSNVFEKEARVADSLQFFYGGDTIGAHEFYDGAGGFSRFAGNPSGHKYSKYNSVQGAIGIDPNWEANIPTDKTGTPLLDLIGTYGKAEKTPVRGLYRITTAVNLGDLKPFSRSGEFLKSSAPPNAFLWCFSGKRIGVGGPDDEFVWDRAPGKLNLTIIYVYFSGNAGQLSIVDDIEVEAGKNYFFKCVIQPSFGGSYGKIVLDHAE